jgi:UDP-galactopyranose mutase
MLFNKYKKMAQKEENVIFGGRLAEYRYYDMHQVYAAALNLVKKEKNPLWVHTWMKNQFIANNV